MEYSNESGITAYTYGNEKLSYETNGVNYKYNYDGRGSVTNLLDNTNTSVVEYNYQPFGETEILGTKANELENTYQFNAESTDALTGLQYLRARYYDSKTGRFTSADTYLGEITDPLSRNLYLYTKNDPVNYVDPSGHIFEAIGQIAQTIQGMAQGIVQGIAQTAVIATAKQATQQAQNSAASSIAKSLVQGAVTAVASKKARTAQTNSQPTQKVEEIDPLAGMKQAAVNLKAEQSKALEQQILAYRAMNTKEANEIATILEEQMKKLCEDKLDKVEIQKAVNRIAELEIESVQNKMKESSDKAFSAVVGFVSTIVLDPLEFAGGTWFAISYALQGKDMGAGYSFFSSKVDTVRNLIEENVPDKQAYNVGKIAGAVTEVVYSLANIANVVNGGLTFASGIQMASSGGEATLVVTGRVAESTLNVGVLAEGTAAEVTFAEKLAGNIQEYSGTGNGGNETGNVTGGSNEIPKEIYNSIKESPNYPEGFVEKQNGTTKNKMDNGTLLENLRKVEKGEWKKVYKDGFDKNGNKISIHYFQSKSGKVFNVKTKHYWSNKGGK